MLLTDISELKAYLEIDPNNTAEDLKLSFLVEAVSQWIEELLNRPGLSYASRTEYYNGTGTSRLLLRSRPVFTTPTILVYEDGSGFFGSTSGSFDTGTTALTYGEGFCLQIDRDDGSSRSGILIKTRGLWEKRAVRQTGYLTPFVGPSYGSIKVVYTAGYTVDTLPASFRMAVNLLVSRLRYVLPLGLELSAESYEDRTIAISAIAQMKNYLLSMVRPFLWPYRNWTM
jgi:hypothetical protein